MRPIVYLSSTFDSDPLRMLSGVLIRAQATCFFMNGHVDSKEQLLDVKKDVEECKRRFEESFPPDNNDIITLFDMQNCKPRTTPADPAVRLRKDDKFADELNQLELKQTLRRYRTMVGKLVYLMVASEPSISFAVSQLSRYFSCPSKEHFAACKCGRSVSSKA